MKKNSPLAFQSQTKVSNEIQCNSLKTSYFFVGQYEMQTFPIIEILRDYRKRVFSSISSPSLPRGIHIISNVLLMLLQSMAISFLLSGSLWPLMRTSAVPPEWSIIALVIQIPAVTATVWGDGRSGSRASRSQIEEHQGGRNWQPFGEGKMATKMRNCYLCDICVVFAHNCKFAN